MHVPAKVMEQLLSADRPTAETRAWERRIKQDQRRRAVRRALGDLLDRVEWKEPMPYRLRARLLGLARSARRVHALSSVCDLASASKKLTGGAVTATKPTSTKGRWTVEWFYTEPRACWAAIAPLTLRKGSQCTCWLLGDEGCSCPAHGGRL